jgi:hypothetical protein
MAASFSYLTSRQANIGHHLDQAKRWIASATDDTHTVAVSYAGFELRNEIELIATMYLRRVLDRPFTNEDVSILSSFKKLENKIYAVDGNQHEIDKKIEFMELLIEKVGAPVKQVRINFGKLASMWHRCSEYCHISWTLASSKEQKRLFPLALADLGEVIEYLQQYAQHNVLWPGTLSPSFAELRAKFISGELDSEAMQAEFHRLGVWGSLEFPGQEPRIFGKETRARDADA